MINPDIETDKIKRYWQDFFDQYDYNDQINNLRSIYPDEKSLYISYNDITGFDETFAQSLMEDPTLYFSIGEEYIRDTIGLYNNRIKRIDIRLTDVPDITGIKYEIRNVRSCNVGTFISISGIIRKNTEVLPRLERAAFKCPACGELTYVNEDYQRLVEPSSCQHCGYNKGKLKLIPEDQNLLIHKNLRYRRIQITLMVHPSPKE